MTGDLSLHVNESMDLTVHFLDQNADDIEGLNPECYTPTFVVNTTDIIAVTVMKMEMMIMLMNDGDDHDDMITDEKKNTDEDGDDQLCDDHGMMKNDMVQMHE